MSNDGEFDREKFPKVKPYGEIWEEIGEFEIPTKYFFQLKKDYHKKGDLGENFTKGILFLLGLKENVDFKHFPYKEGVQESEVDFLIFPSMVIECKNWSVKTKMVRDRFEKEVLGRFEKYPDHICIFILYGGDVQEGVLKKIKEELNKGRLVFIKFKYPIDRWNWNESIFPLTVFLLLIKPFREKIAEKMRGEGFSFRNLLRRIEWLPHGGFLLEWCDNWRKVKFKDITGKETILSIPDFHEFAKSTSLEVSESKDDSYLKLSITSHRTYEVYIPKRLVQEESLPDSIYMNYPEEILNYLYTTYNNRS